MVWLQPTKISNGISSVSGVGLMNDLMGTSLRFKACLQQMTMELIVS
jgi:hypothetical protein